MKNLKILLFTALVAFQYSCTENEDSMINDVISTTSAIENINAITFEEEVSDLVSEGMQYQTSLLTNKTETNDLKQSSSPRRYRFNDCADIVIDEENNTKTITFLEDCENNRGKNRTGTIVISYSDENDQVGSFRQIEYIDFYINNVKMEGIRRSEVISIDENGNKTTLNTLTGGKMIYEDGTFSTKSAEYTRFVYIEDDEKIYSTLEGNSEGVSTEGISFSMEIITPIKFLYNCTNASSKKRKRIPVEGVKNILNADALTIIDFGQGECDRDVNVTINGETEILDLKELKRNSFFRIR